MDITERLNRDLEKKEKEIEKLETKISEMEEAQEDLEYRDEWRWRHIRALTPEENMDLPVPRLEIRSKRKSAYITIVDYGLVSLHLSGDVMYYPFSSTEVRGKSLPLSTPFRAGGDILNDMYELNLRGFVIDGDENKELSLEDKDDLPSGLVIKMKQPPLEKYQV
jgi:hypothetical protein